MMNLSQKRFIAIIELLRPGWWPACFFIGLTPGMLAIVWNTGSLEEFIQWRTVLWVFAYWTSIVGMYAFNDLVGIDEDAIVNPKRPLPSGRISKNQTFLVALFFIILGISIWWITFQNLLSSLIQLTCILLIGIYSAKFKNNILLSLAAGFIPVSVWIAFTSFNEATVALFLLVFFWEMTLDVPENILHYEGDKKIHPYTFAIFFGPERLAKVGIFFALPVVFAVIWLFFLLNMSYVFLFIALPGSLFLVYSQLSIRKSFTPFSLGQSLGFTMFSIFIINIGLIMYTIVQSYL